VSAPGAPAPTELVHRLRPAAGEPQGALVLLHGRGADEHDLYPVLDLLDRQRRLLGVTVRAPLMLAPGGYHWYVVRRVGFPDPASFHQTVSALAPFLDALPDRLGVPWTRTVLGGFSQGGVMSYALSLGRGRPAPAATLALSSFLPAVEGFELDLQSRRGLPVGIAHGTLDPVIAVDFAREARARLQGAGLAVSYWETAVPHSIDPRVLGDLQRWLQHTLDPSRPPVAAPGAPRHP
jgi:phospholipase/carboxylesterase